MEFERWLLSEGLSGSLTQEEFNKAKHVYHQQRKQGNEIGVTEVLIRLGYIDKERLNQLKQEYIQQQNNPLEETLMQMHKLTLFEELLKKDQPTEDAIYPTQIIEETGNLKPDLPPVSFDDTLRHDSQEQEQELPAIVEEPKKDLQMIGRYKVHRKLGEGNMGEVFLVRDDNLQRDVALKLISSGIKNNKNIQRFIREAQAVAKLDHPNIVKVYDISEEENVFFTMQYIEGQSLEEYLAKNKRMSLRKAVEITKKIAEALHFAHQKKIIHRDIKPANVMLDKKGVPYIMDFGLAREIEGGSKVTKTQAFAGTPSYMSPEQARNRHKEIDAQSDIYSLGVTFYELLTGRLPFEARELVALLTQIAKAAPPPPTTYVKEIPRNIENICLKAMAKSKEKRYYRAIDMAKDLEHYLRKKQVNKAHNVHFQREDFASKSQKWLPAVAAFVIGLVVMYMFAPPSNTQELLVLENENADLKNELKKYRLQKGVKTDSEVKSIAEKHTFIGKKQGFFLTPVVHNNFLVAPLLKRIKGNRYSVLLCAARLTNKNLDANTLGIFDPSINDHQYIIIKNINKTSVVAARIWKSSVYVVTGHGVYRFYGGEWKLICRINSLGNTSQPVFCGDTMFFVSHGKRCIIAIDLDSLQQRQWSLSLKNPKVCYLGTSEETLVVSKIDEENPQRSKVQIFHVDKNKVQEKDRYTTESLVNCEPVIKEGKVYTAAGQYFEVYNINKKQKTLLYSNLKQNDYPIYFDEYTNVICKKQVLGFEIKDDMQAKLWEKDMGEEILTTPAGLGNSMFYIANQSYLYLMFRGLAIITYNLKVPNKSSLKMYENWFATPDTIYYAMTEKKGYKDETSYIYKFLK